MVATCKLSRMTCSVREDKLCPPSLSKSSFARSNSSDGNPGQEVKGIGLGCPPEVESYLTRLRLSNEKANLLPFGNSVVNKP